MFFGKRRRKKEEGDSPKFEETHVGEDFGFDEDTGRPTSPPPSAPESRRDDPPPPAGMGDYEHRRPEPPGDASRGRSLDDATFVGGTADPSPPSGSSRRLVPADHEPPLVLGASDPEEEDVSDATRFIGAPVDARLTVVAWLVAASGSGRGRDYRLEANTTTVGGAADSTIRLTGDEFASTLHAEIRQEGGRYVLQDLRSTNGTFHNDARVQQAALQDGDRIRFGLSEFVFKCVQL